MSLNFGQIPPLTTELAALERLKNRCHHIISVDIDPIFFKLAGNIQTADIVELIGPEKTIALLLENYSKYLNDFT